MAIQRRRHFCKPSVPHFARRITNYFVMLFDKG